MGHTPCHDVWLMEYLFILGFIVLMSILALQASRFFSTTALIRRSHNDLMDYVSIANYKSKTEEFLPITISLANLERLKGEYGDSLPDLRELQKLRLRTINLSREYGTCLADMRHFQYLRKSSAHESSTHTPIEATKSPSTHTEPTEEELFQMSGFTQSKNTGTKSESQSVVSDDEFLKGNTAILMGLRRPAKVYPECRDGTAPIHSDEFGDSEQRTVVTI